MRFKIKVCSLVLALVLTFSLFSACVQNDSAGGTSKEKDGVTQVEKTKVEDTSTDNKQPGVKFPIVETPITLKIFVGRTAAQPSYKDMYFSTEYEKLSNIKIDWLEVPWENVSERKNIILATGDLPDAFMKGGFSQDELFQYGTQGLFIPLNELFNKHAPNFNAILKDTKSYMGVEKALTCTDGNIYGMPYLAKNDFYSVRMASGLFINVKWLDTLGLEKPVTTDDFYNVLKKFKEGDPNKNGKPDEVPWTSLGGLYNTMGPLMGSWGLRNRGAHHGYVDYDEANGSLRFIPKDPKYKEVLEYFNKLYKEGLLDEEIFTQGLPEYSAKGNENRIGVQSLVTHVYAGDCKEDFEGQSPLVGPHGDQIWSQALSPVLTSSAFVITNKNKYPGETLEWVDYLYSEDGMKLFFMGKEGESYKIDSNGDYELTDKIKNNPDGLTLVQALSKYSPYSGGSNPALLSKKYFIAAKDPVIWQAADKLFKYEPKEVWGQFSYTVEEADEMNAMGGDIYSYIAEKEAEFVTGKASFSDWQDYLKTFDRMNIDKYMKIYEVGYKRYMGK